MPMTNAVNEKIRENHGIFANLPHNLPPGARLRVLRPHGMLPKGAVLRALKVTAPVELESVAAITAPGGAKLDPGTGRLVLHGSDDPKELREAAKRLAPKLEAMLREAVEGIPNARLEAVRDSKEAKRVAEKVKDGKPVETQPDHLAARILVETPKAKEQVAERLRAIGEVQREDRFEDEGGPNDFRADTHHVIVDPSHRATLRTAEVQILTPEQHEASERLHGLYELQRTADVKGDTQTSARLAKQLARANNKAADDAEERQGEPKFKLGSTQASVPHDSEAFKALEKAQGQIEERDLAGDGKDTGGFHVTLRYGVNSNRRAGMKKFLAEQAPFVVTLGKTASFEPSKNSDGAAVVIAPLHSAELHRLHAEIEKQGDFAPSSFPDYKPHVTLAYVKPEAVANYTGLADTDGKQFLVDEIAITDRNGDVELVPLTGTKSLASIPPMPLRAPVPPGARPYVWIKGERFLVPENGGYQQALVRYWNPGFNGGRPGGHAKLLDGKVIDIPKDALPIHLDLTNFRPITESAEEEQTMRSVSASLGAYVADYLVRNTKDGVTTLATDAAKKLIPAFEVDPTKSDRDVTSSAAAIRDSALATVLAARVDKQRPDVLITTGSPGSGKTTGQAFGGTIPGIAIKLESIADDADTWRTLLKQILDSGRKPIIEWVYVDDPKKTVKRMLRRSLGHEQRPGIGRTVQIDYMADAYAAVPKVLTQMKREFGSKIEMLVIDNSGPLGEAKVSGDFDGYSGKMMRLTPADVRRQMNEEMDGFRKGGRFDDERGKAVLKAAKTTDAEIRRSDARKREEGMAAGRRTI